MNGAPELLNEAVRLWPDLASVKEALERDPESTIGRAFAERPGGGKEIVGVPTGEDPGVIVGVPTGPGGLGGNLETRSDLDVAAAKRALEKIQRDGPRATLEPDEAAALEILINFTARPAILIKDGRFLDPPPPWEDLEQRRQQIETEARKVGRVQLDGHPQLPYAGTAFVVGERTVVTNRHVVQAFAISGDDGWVYRKGMSVSLTYADDPDNQVAPEFPVERVVAVHPHFDLAILQLAPGEGELPPPMTLASAAPEPHEQRRVYALGYPAPDPFTSPQARAKVFGDIYNVKRLQPGQIMRLVPDEGIFYHDCSTLAGNSGSCVVDLETNLVLGVHFTGKYLQYNQAVSLWRMKDWLLRHGVVNVA